MIASTNPDDLFTLPLEQFTAARNALAKELARSGSAEEAATVRGLVKPSRTAWALNQLARRQPGDVGQLLDAGERVRAAQNAALDGDARELRAAGREEQAVVEKLVAAAVELLPQGSSTPAPTRERLRRTLRAAALDPATGTLLREGRLTTDVEVSGFGLEALGDPPTGPAPTGQTHAAEMAKADEQRLARRESTRLREEAERARQRARRLWDDAEAAERRAADARARADEATQAAVDAQHQADQAMARAEEAARQVDS